MCVCSLCDGIQCNQEQDHNWIHKPTSKTLPNTFSSTELCFKLFECSLCGDKKDQELTDHKMFHQSCTLCGGQYQECKPCTGNTHENCYRLRLGSFKLLHDVDTNGDCTKCHACCRHWDVTKINKPIWLTLNDTHCSPCYNICDMCGSQVKDEPQVHVWNTQNTCDNCGHYISEKQQKRRRFLEMATNVKKQCLDIVGDSLDKLTADVLASMEL